MKKSQVRMTEFHVDSFKKFQEEINKKSKYGGNLSVRFPEGELSATTNASSNDSNSQTNCGLEMMILVQSY